MDDEFSILDEENNYTWRIEMRVYLNTMGVAIWKAVIGGSVSLKNNSKFASQREGKKNDTLALNTILSGLSSPIKESMGQCTSSKDLWIKLEETYQSKKEKEEPNPVTRRINQLIEVQQHRAEVDERLQKYHDNMKALFDRKSKDKDFLPGDLVLKWDTRKEDSTKHGKFDHI